MNMGTTLAAYATICRETGRPFVFPGSAAQWSGLTDMTDARQLAAQMLWAATTDAARNEAFNIVNGDVFRWSWMWGRIAKWFGIEAAPFDGIVRPLETQMSGDAAIWKQIAERHGLVEKPSPWLCQLPGDRRGFLRSVCTASTRSPHSLTLTSP